jgi:[ribosomal protein S5]-alanine N-acetyltransferase
VAPVLSGSDVVIRPWQASDADDLEPACGDPDICRYTTVPETFTPEAARAWIARQQTHEREGTALVLAVEQAQTRQAVGMVGLFGLGRRDGPRLGYWLTREHRGRGLATSAVRLLLGWALAREAIDHVLIDVEPTNAASLRLANRLGAEPVGPRVRELADGRTVELDRFIITKRALTRENPANAGLS